MTDGVIRHQHRHYKTLIVLVLAMTGGTFLLYWIAQLSPITPLRGETRPSNLWNRIMVRAADEHVSRGFFHYRIDTAGRLFQSNAWKAGAPQRLHPGVIQILLTCPDEGVHVSSSQADMLSQIISQLRRRYGIPVENVGVESTQSVVGQDFNPLRHRRRT